MATRAWILRAEARLTQLEAWRKAQQPEPQIAALLKRIEDLEAKAHTHQFGPKKKDAE